MRSGPGTMLWEKGTKKMFWMKGALVLLARSGLRRFINFPFSWGHTIIIDYGISALTHVSDDMWGHVRSPPDGLRLIFKQLPHTQATRLVHLVFKCVSKTDLPQAINYFNIRSVCQMKRKLIHQGQKKGSVKSLISSRICAAGYISRLSHRQLM